MATKTMRGFPIAHVVGFFASLILTVIAAAVALKTDLSFNVVMWIIGSLAIIQAGLQLFMFMHVNEGEDKKAQIINIVYGIFIALVIVIGTIWVMTSGHAAH